MGWQDRDYNPHREQLNAYFATPAALLQYSMPLFSARGIRVRLHFWFLLTAVFNLIAIVREHEPLYYFPLDIATLLIALFIHESGHLLFARRVGGNHLEWTLWPLGGMVAPICPRTPKSVFIANIGGIAFSLPLAGIALAGLHFIPGTAVAHLFTLSPFNPLVILATNADPVLAVLTHTIAVFAAACFAITVINLFPCFWFDGGHIWHSILWPKMGAGKALEITCMAGMVLAVPFFCLALWSTDLLGLVIWALIFADCFNRRRAVQAAGPGVLDDDDASPYNYMDTPDRPVTRKKSNKRYAAAARKRAQAEQAEQAEIDAILVKVKEKGLHSLNWFEKRALKRATERQRQRDLAERR